MRYLLLKMGLLFALISTGTAIAAESQQDEQSYLPPATLRASPGAASADGARHRARAAPEPARKYVRTARRHHERQVYREARYRRYAGPRFFFGLF